MEYGKEVICYNNKGRPDLTLGKRYMVRSYNADHDAYWLDGVDDKCARNRFEDED